MRASLAYASGWCSRFAHALIEDHPSEDADSSMNRVPYLSITSIMMRTFGPGQVGVGSFFSMAGTIVRPNVYAFGSPKIVASGAASTAKKRPRLVGSLFGSM